MDHRTIDCLFERPRTAKPQRCSLEPDPVAAATGNYTRCSLTVATGVRHPEGPWPLKPRTVLHQSFHVGGSGNGTPHGSVIVHALFGSPFSIKNKYSPVPSHKSPTHPLIRPGHAGHDMSAVINGHHVQQTPVVAHRAIQFFRRTLSAPASSTSAAKPGPHRCCLPVPPGSLWGPEHSRFTFPSCRQHR